MCKFIDFCDFSVFCLFKDRDFRVLYSSVDVIFNYDNGSEKDYGDKS